MMITLCHSFQQNSKELCRSILAAIKWTSLEAKQISTETVEDRIRRTNTWISRLFANVWYHKEHLKNRILSYTNLQYGNTKLLYLEQTCYKVRDNQSFPPFLQRTTSQTLSCYMFRISDVPRSNKRQSTHACLWYFSKCFPSIKEIPQDYNNNFFFSCSDNGIPF